MMIFALLSDGNNASIVHRTFIGGNKIVVSIVCFASALFSSNTILWMLVV